jgi:hypothetical protein
LTLDVSAVMHGMFWGTTCAHCLGELAAVDGFSRRQRERGLTLDVLPVCVDETDPAIVADVVGPRPAGRPHYVDPAGTDRLRYDVQALPTFVLVDPSGRLVARAEGSRDWTDAALDALVLSLCRPALREAQDAARGDR